jgi:hypothetical protein
MNIGMLAEELCLRLAFCSIFYSKDIVMSSVKEVRRQPLLALLYYLLLVTNPVQVFGSCRSTHWPYSFTLAL